MREKGEKYAGERIKRGSEKKKDESDENLKIEKRARVKGDRQSK